MIESNNVVHRGSDQLEHAISIENVKAQIQAIQQLMKFAMKEGEHYGVIPGCQKPSLLKSGGEKLGMTFRLAPYYEIKETELSGGHREYSIICTLKHIITGQIWGQGVGSCSTMETKWRFRKAEQTCPKCGKPAIIKGKKEYGGGWVCFKSKGGCGAKYSDGDKTIENQEMGRIEHDNPADYHNTCLKMGKKRAHIDAILTSTAASDIFTQDIEDLVENGVIIVKENAKSNVKPPPVYEAQAEAEPPRYEEAAFESEMPKPQTGETEPPDDDRPAFPNDIYGRLDEMVYDKANGNIKHIASIYETITGFTGADGKKRYCTSIEQIKKWKPGAAEKAKRKLEEYLAMGTKFKFEE